MATIPPADRGARRPASETAPDGLPGYASGEPLLARWFVIAMLVLVPIGIGVSVWALTSFDREPVTAAERRPPGTAEITHQRGDAALNQADDVEAAPGCMSEIDLVGDRGARSAAARAVGAACQLVTRPGLEAAARGLDVWAASDGVLRFAVFELTGVDSSSRVENGRIVIELNAKFQFEDATEAAPFLIHELTHLGQTWPGIAVSAADELAAMTAQQLACERLAFRQARPRGCLDADELLERESPLEALLDAGYPDSP